MNTAYGKKALSREFIALSTASGDKRTEQLSKVANRLGGLIAGKQLDKQSVVSALVNACNKNGLIKDQSKGAVLEIIHSGIAEGMKNPKQPTSKKFEHQGF